ncbi:MAG: NAD(P)H-hydrate dehydratase, partial [Methylobacteriaceae bacterium]|nr:NAD(P)H-hydrate dehydratase [Methylobacteriaceae bacterium]
FRRKPGHCLLPGRMLCGRIVVADIGIPASALTGIGPRISTVGPAAWRDSWRPPAVDGHKYARGHCVVTAGGATRTGAARLAARAALRVGAGLVTVAAPRAATAAAAAQLTAIMLTACEGAAALAALLADRRHNAVVLGPAGGVGKRLETMARAALASPAAVVLDADALTSFAGRADELAAAIGGRDGVALTPHDGEFARLFGPLPGDRLARARAAAQRIGAVVVSKGADTVVAAPDGRAAILDVDAPWLATAGSGDVLAGLIGGLAAQGLPMFQACAAAVWLHAATGRAIGPGLIAEDLPERLPDILRAHFGAGQGGASLGGM